MLDKVFEIVRQNGPVLPIEVGKKLGIDSFVAHAYLMQLVEAKKIKASKEKVGNSFLYFVPGKENAAELRASTLTQQTKKTAKTFQKESIKVTPDVAKKREAFVQRLKEIEEREKKEKRERVDLEKIKAQMQKDDFIERFKQAITPFLTQKPEEVEIKDPEIKVNVETEPIEKAEDKTEQLEKEKRQPKTKLKDDVKPKKKKVLFGSKTNAVELAIEYLTERGAEIISKNIKKKKEADLIVKVPSGIGSIKMFVKIKDKKTINEADLSLTYTQGQNKKLPILFLTTGKLTKTAQNYLKVIEGLLKVKFLEAEEK